MFRIYMKQNEVSLFLQDRLGDSKPSVSGNCGRGVNTLCWGWVMDYVGVGLGLDQIGWEKMDCGTLSGQ